MNYDFDKVIDRTNTNSLKYDFAVERGRPADVLPLWVADMDFPAPQPVLDALQKAVAHGIFGYSEVKTPYYQAVAGWFERHFGWRPEESWLIKTPGVVCALAMAVRAYTKPGDAVLIQSPVYYPFYSVVQDNDRKLVASELLYKDGRYSIDLADFEAKIRENQVKMVILCSPHNPIGRVWTLEELQATDLVPFQSIISSEDSAPFVMVTHLSYPNIVGDDTPADLSSVIVTDLLREKLGFRNVIITDSHAMASITDRYSAGEAAVKALAAGCDMILMPDDLQAAFDAVKAAVADGTLTQARIDESVLRILTVKAEFGILQ